MIKNFDDKNIVNHSKTMRIWIRRDDLITRNMTKNIKSKTTKKQNRIKYINK